MKAFRLYDEKRFMIVIFVWKSITVISFTNYKTLQPQFSFMTIETFSIGGLESRVQKNHKDIITHSYNFRL